jgi:PST family polysaccharide transporter
MVIGQVLFPQWFFQGMEQMKYITFLNIFAKIVFTIAIFIFVHTQSDYWRVPLINSLGFLSAGVISLWIIKRDFNINFQLQPLQTLKKYFIDSWDIFISNVAISLYTVSTTFILGIFTNNTIVGYFSAADKIRGAFQGLLNPISQTIYPYISKKSAISKFEAIKFIRKIAIIIGIFSGLISIFIFLFADFLVSLLLGSQYERSILVLKIISVLPFLIGLSNIFGIQTMVTFGFKKLFSRILISGSILNIILSIILVPLFKEIGSAVSVVVVESFITIVMLFFLQKRGIDLIKGRIDV